MTGFKRYSRFAPNRSLNKLVRENAMTDERMDVARSGLWAADQLGFFLCFI